MLRPDVGDRHDVINFFFFSFLFFLLLGKVSVMIFFGWVFLKTGGLWKTMSAVVFPVGSVS